MDEKTRTKIFSARVNLQAALNDLDELDGRLGTFWASDQIQETLDFLRDLSNG